MKIMIATVFETLCLVIDMASDIQELLIIYWNRI